MLTQCTCCRWILSGFGLVQQAPLPMRSARALQLSAGQTHILALLVDGSVWSWGRGAKGQLGHAKLGSEGQLGSERQLEQTGGVAETILSTRAANLISPRRVEGLPPAVVVAAGAQWPCAVGMHDRALP